MLFLDRSGVRVWEMRQQASSWLAAQPGEAWKARVVVLGAGIPDLTTLGGGACTIERARFVLLV